MRLLVLVSLILAACGGAPAQSPSEPAPTRTPPGCTEPRYAAFDFWVGDWEVTNAQGELAGHNTITREQGGCVLVEHWRGAGGSTGTSLSYYDPQRDAWIQHWVASGGGVVDLEGGPRDGAMHLAGTLAKKDGTVTRLRGTWTPNPDGTVRQWFEESTDDGATWNTWFDGTYAPAR